MSTSKSNSTLYSTPLDFNDALINARPLVLAVIHRTGIRDRATAEDIAQDAFIKAWQASEGFNAKSKVSSWLCAIAKNAAIDHMRKHRRMINLGDNTIPEKGDSTSFSNPLAKMLEAEQEKSVKADVATALSKLSANHAQVIKMYHIDEMSYEAISKKLKIPQGSVMSRLFHARKKMRLYLK